jgi:Mitochondrial carrier protein.
MAEEKIHPFQFFLAGGVGGALTVLVGHPFDTCKVRLQTANSKQPEYTGNLFKISLIGFRLIFLAFLAR